MLLRPFVFLALLSAAHAVEYFVSPKGNDDWSGTRAEINADHTDGPFATLERARKEARLHPQEPRTITLRGGLHEVAKGLVLDAKDSGTAEAPVIWRAYEKEQPILIGGRAITGWKPYKDGILQADVAAQGFKGINFRQLLFAGQRQILARYPNYDPKNPYGGGWAYADGEMWPMYADKEGENKHTLKVKNYDWQKWAHPDEVEVFVFPRYNWWNDILRVKSVDESDYTITTAKDGSYAMRANDRYYFQGGFENLDAPGEWYLDRTAGVLYFMPPAPIDSAAVYAPTTRDIIKATDTQYVTFRGLTFECAEGSAIQLNKTSHCRVIGCTVRNTGDFGGTGISVSNGTDNGVIGCDVSFTGSSGVSLGGGDRITLTEAKNFAENCYIHHVGVYYKQGVGVALSGVGQRVSHCLIHDTPRFGIMFAGNSHVLEYNHLRHLALETEDVGATYCGGRDWISPRGTVIRYNFIHDVLGYGWNGKWTSPYFAWGIYLDDNSGGVDVIGNIVTRCGRSLIHGHSARDCKVENNIFVEGGLRQWEFNGWTTNGHFWINTLDQMVKGYESVVNQPAWKGMRGMETHPRDIPDSEGRVMSGNVLQRNIIAWKNDEAKALNVVNNNPERNTFDQNLYWHEGREMKTGIRKAGRVIGGDIAPNPTFEGELGKLPKDWNWQIHTPTTHGELVDDGGQRAVRIDAAFNAAKKRDNYPILTSRDVELQPGHSYRLKAKLRSDTDAAKTALMVQFYLPPKDGQPGHFWASGPANATLTTAWKEYEFAFTVPGKGEKGYHEQMKKFKVRLDWAEKAGALFAASPVLEETESLDEWASWQASGGDGHSIIADPKFVAPEKDDFRLQPDSPAFALGFKAIPTEKIGPYQSPDRATWPIVEAEGAREHPIAP